jgi:CubicO group peptidase (beta-lactamase class C family)
MLRILILVSSLCLISSGGAAAQVQTPDGITAAQQQQMQSLMEAVYGSAAPAPSLSVFVDIGGEPLFQHSVGYADLEQQVAAGPDTVYQIGSITKSYTALAVLQLVEEGKLDLDDPVSTHLGDYTGPGARGTIRQLLTHTSGIPNYTALPEAQDMLTWVPTQRDDILALFADKPLNFPPGTQFNYSNSGYYLLGLIVEAASGEDYYDYLQAHVLEPFGLERTYSGRYEDIVEGRARGYTPGAEGFLNAGVTPYLTPFAAGSLQATAQDIARFRRTTMIGDQVSPALRAMLLELGSFPDGTPQRYALGALERSEHHGHTVWGHSGGISGFQSYHGYYPDLDLSVVVLTNSQPPASPRSVARQVVSVLLGEEIAAAEPVVPVALSQSELQALAGEYRMSPFRLTGDGLISLIIHDEGLQLRLGAADAEAAPTLPLIAVGRRRLLVGGGFNISVEAPGSGAVTTLTIVMEGTDMPAQRVAASD